MSVIRRTLALALAAFGVFALMPMDTAGVRAADDSPGSQGTDTSLPATVSQVTVGGRGGFADLAVTVNQTRDLSNQAVSITWTGGKPTVSGPGSFAANYLQIMQCWGDDDGTNPDNPGPPPEQCIQGAAAGDYAGGGPSLPNQFAVSRIISRSTWDNFDPSVGFLDTRTKYVWRPFRAVDGTVVNAHTNPDFNPDVVGGNFWLNPYFNIITTNEIAGAKTGPNGNGAELFKVDTGLESTGLGCGQSVQPVAGGGTKVPQCWIVIVPRGAPTDENAGTPFAASADQEGVVTSPLSPAAWQNRIAIPIGFKPLDSPCSLAADNRRIAGSEIVLTAVSSWQPALCLGGAPLPYSYAQIGDTAARQQLASSAAGGPGMVVVSKPLSAASADPASPAVYAPLSVSGVVIGFNIERNPKLTASAEETALLGIRVAELNLTPRLVAKLLTQSYRGQITVGDQDPGYAWATTNPLHMGLDPDFLQFNPEFRQLFQLADRLFSGLQLPSGNSDAIEQVWNWVLSDPEARAWMDGAPDPWGMKVNQVYATTELANSTGFAFGSPLPTSFPKADPFCYQAPARGANNSIVPPPLCGTDWMPYNRGFADSARIVRIANDRAKIVNNAFAVSASDVWKATQPQGLSQRTIMSITDTPSAALFGVQMARLSRAGDNGANREFIAPDAVGLTAGVAAMAPSTDDPAVLITDPLVTAPGAYPLTTIAYGALKPLSLDAAARDQYATVLDYAGGPGQVPGDALGFLPKGYVPLPDALHEQTVEAANLVRTMTAPSATTTVPTPESSTTNVAGSLPPSTTVSSLAPTPTTTYRASSGSSSSGGRATAAATTPVAVPDTVAATTGEEPATTAAAETETSTAAPAAEVDEPATTTPSVMTPIVDVARSRYAVPGLGALAIASALGALEITKRPRRRLAGEADPLAVVGEIEQA